MHNRVTITVTVAVSRWKKMKKEKSMYKWADTILKMKMDADKLTDRQINKQTNKIIIAIQDNHGHNNNKSKHFKGFYIILSVSILISE